METYATCHEWCVRVPTKVISFFFGRGGKGVEKKGEKHLEWIQICNTERSGSDVKVLLMCEKEWLVKESGQEHTAHGKKPTTS